MDSAYSVSLTRCRYLTAYRCLRGRLGQVGWIALGSVLNGVGPARGPRCQWSRRLDRKTITVALSAEQLAWFKEAIANQRKVWDLLLPMPALTVALHVQAPPEHHSTQTTLQENLRP